MNDPLVSVCCITYNHACYVDAAIASIFNQSHRDIEIIVIDDGSTDDTLAKLETLKGESPFPMLIQSHQNTGRVGRNVNLGLSRARGKYVRFLSLDDLFTSDSTAEFVRMMELDESLQFAACDRAKMIDKFGNPMQESSNSPFLDMQASELSVQAMLDMEHARGGTFYIQNAMFRKDILERSGGCDEDLLGDDITLRIKLFRQMIAEHSLKFAILNRTAFLYRIHDKNLHKDSKRQIDTMIQICDKYYDGKPSPILYDWIGHAVRSHVDAVKSLMSYRFVHGDSQSLRFEIDDRIDGFQYSLYWKYLPLKKPHWLFRSLDSLRRTSYRLLRSIGLAAIAFRFLSTESAWYKRVVALAIQKP